MSVATSAPAMDVPESQQRSVSRDAIVRLSGVSWHQYQTLRDIDGNRHVRMTFDAGELILMSPGRLHERITALLNRMVIAWTEERSIPVQSGGSTTIRRELRSKGFEPDASYFIQHEAELRGRDEYDPEVDPPPDLTIEVDVSSLSSGRMSLYADFGVPEVWRWYDDTIVVFTLIDGAYAAAENPGCLPGFPLDLANDLLQRRLEADETSLLREFRAAIRNLAE